MASFARAMILVMLSVAVFFKPQNQQHGTANFSKRLNIHPNWSFLFVHYKNRIASLSCSLTKTLWSIFSPSAVMQYLPFLKRNKIPPRLFSKSGSFCSFFLRDVFLYFISASKITSILSVFFHVCRGLARFLL